MTYGVSECKGGGGYEGLNETIESQTSVMYFFFLRSFDRLIFLYCTCQSVELNKKSLRVFYRHDFFSATKTLFQRMVHFCDCGA